MYSPNSRPDPKSSHLDAITMGKDLAKYAFEASLSALPSDEYYSASEASATLHQGPKLVIDVKLHRHFMPDKVTNWEYSAAKKELQVNGEVILNSPVDTTILQQLIGHMTERAQTQIAEIFTSQSPMPGTQLSLKPASSPKITNFNFDHEEHKRDSLRRDLGAAYGLEFRLRTPYEVDHSFGARFDDSVVEMTSGLYKRNTSLITADGREIILTDVSDPNLLHVEIQTANGTTEESGIFSVESLKCLFKKHHNKVDHAIPDESAAFINSI